MLRYVLPEVLVDAARGPGAVECFVAAGGGARVAGVAPLQGSVPPTRSYGASVNAQVVTRHRRQLPSVHLHRTGHLHPISPGVARRPQPQH
jgi:hypothetical protein